MQLERFPHLGGKRKRQAFAHQHMVFDNQNVKHMHLARFLFQNMTKMIILSTIFHCKNVFQQCIAQAQGCGDAAQKETKMPFENPQDPMRFAQQMWGNMGFTLPGMVAPTFDVDELDKRIADLKAVEAWLQVNLSMLQMSITGLEMQKTTINTVQTVSRIASQSPEAEPPEPADAGDAAPGTVGEALQKATLWPWDLMCQVQSQIQEHLEEAQARQQQEEAVAQAQKSTAGQKAGPAPQEAAAKPAKKPAAKKTAAHTAAKP
jgi:hypothetical protein